MFEQTNNHARDFIIILFIFILGTLYGTAQTWFLMNNGTLPVFSRTKTKIISPVVTPTTKPTPTNTPSPTPTDTPIPTAVPTFIPRAIHRIIPTDTPTPDTLYYQGQ